MQLLLLSYFSVESANTFLLLSFRHVYDVNDHQTASSKKNARFMPIYGDGCMKNAPTFRLQLACLACLATGEAGEASHTDRANCQRQQGSLW